MMRHFFSLTHLWEVMGRCCPCFPPSGALQENPTLTPVSRAVRRISPVRGEGGWLHSAIPTGSPALRVRGWAAGWEQPPAPAVSFPRFQSCSLSTSSISMEANDFAQLPNPKNGMGALLILTFPNFLGIQLLEDQLVLLVCVALLSLHRQDPTSLWHRAPSRAHIYSVFQRRVVQHLNCCWPLPAGQGLPTGAHAAPVELPEVSEFSLPSSWPQSCVPKGPGPAPSAVLTHASFDPLADFLLCGVCLWLLWLRGTEKIKK